MSLHAAAKHLASKGRNGDTTLVHMTKGEVAGLQALAKKQGTSLTINPHTGLPEAFSLKSLLPMAAGAALVASGVGAPMAAAMVGGGMFAATGSLKQGLMAGLGAYGGAGLAGGLGAMGAEAGTAAAAGEAEAAAAKAVADEQAKQAVLQEAASGVGAPPALAPTVSSEVAEQSARDYASNAAGNTFELNGGYRPTFGPEAMGPQMPGATTDAMIPSNTGFSASTQQTLAQNPMQSGLEAAYKNPGAYVDKLGGGMQAAKYGAAAAAPAIADAMTPKPYQEPDIKGDSDMGQRYAFESGYDNNLPGRTGQPSYTKISNEEAKKLYGFADGGEVGYPGEPVVRMAAGGSASPNGGSTTGGGLLGNLARSTGAFDSTQNEYSYDPVSQTYGSGSSVGASRAQAVPSNQYGDVGYTGNVGDYSAADAAAARGGLGTGIDYSGYDTAPNQGIAAMVNRGNPNQKIVDLYKEVEAKKIADEKAAAEKEASTLGPYGDGTGWFGTPVGAEQNYGYAAGGGISTLGGYSDGGRLLKGPGDGVSDSIPAVIGRKQPARLADGEFVVPARIVSEIGNGSTEAGARKLYAMMDRVQKARGKTVGKGKVAKNTRADKFLPA